MEADPSCSLAHVASCVSKGRLTFFVSNRRKVELAREARQDAYKALACDQSSDLAHHVLGRWHCEMAEVHPPMECTLQRMQGVECGCWASASRAGACDRTIVF